MTQNNVNIEPTRFQICCERALLTLSIVVIIYHTLLSIYQFYDIFVGTFLDQFRYTLFFTFLVFCAIYFLIVKIVYPQTFGRITKFLRSLLCPEIILMLIFLIWYSISLCAAILRYGDSYLSANRLYTTDVFITILVLFPLCVILSPQQRKAALHFVIHVIVCTMTLLMLIVLYFIFNSIVLTVPVGKVYMGRNLRLNVVGNPNATGAYASVIFMVCVYMFFSQKRLLKALYALAALVHMLILFLSNSITCYLSVSSFVSVVTFFFFFNRLSSNRLKHRILISLSASLGSIIIFSILRWLSFTIFEAITHFSEINKSTSGLRTINQNQVNIWARIRIWEYSLRSMITDFHRAVFGTTPAGVIPTINMISNGKYNMYTHNQFMEVGVAMGFPGLLLYTVWIALIARNCLKVVISSKNNSAPGIFVLPAIILGLVISNLAESILLYYHFLPGSFFFLLCGAVTAESRMHEFPTILHFHR